MLNDLIQYDYHIVCGNKELHYFDQYFNTIRKKLYSSQFDAPPGHITRRMNINFNYTAHIQKQPVIRWNNINKSTMMRLEIIGFFSVVSVEFHYCPLRYQFFKTWSEMFDVWFNNEYNGMANVSPPSIEDVLNERPVLRSIFDD
jgi:hypothetical protein